ncbi:N-acetylgalactosamine-6-sulfatase [Coraliomargarita sinensis]|uniref:N-acetylgalactosamine-6-sulfatase n=1 Tax=Coraliomargarita sinensis TaxID=2174842 RepID=A0A317ZJ96_9BACT|nr:sulfatase [Coraliomargarita sinensis]PXA03849.1 N-acetylgalactosamine-6-sulfatase [Coraliomargarita sinensis]
MIQRHLICLLVALGFAQADVSRPNILLVLIDDMGPMDTSVPFLADSEGQPVKHPLNQFYHTPEMEKLAAQGFRSSRFYANSVCSPTRASIMTGQSSARHRTTQWIRLTGRNGGSHDPADWNWSGLGKDNVTLARLLQSAGYRTIHCGKGHFAPFNHEGSNPKDIGFDVNIGGGSIGRPSSYYGEEGYGHIRGTSKIHAVPGLEAYRGTKTYLTEALTLELKKEISAAVEAKKPFFAYMSHYALHSPFQADPRFKDRYAGIQGRSKREVAYATMAEGIDKSLGDLMRHIESLGVAEDTLVVFLGDNGSDAPMGNSHGHTSSAPLRGKKATHYEGGMRVPFIAAWAQPSEDAQIQKRFPITQGILEPTDIGTVHDLLPTLLKVTGVEAPEEHVIDGASLWPWFAGIETAQPQRFLMHFPHSHRSSYFTVLIDGHRKLVWHQLNEGDERFELFDLEADPYEKKNLAEDRPALLKEMRGLMAEELMAVDAQAPKGVDIRTALIP